MAKVNFIRRHTDVEVDEEPIVDGNFIVTGDGNIYIDYGLERIKIVGGGGGSATGDTLPIGSITAYGKETAPANWLICDGSVVSRSAYADLFAVIGTKYGEGDGSTTFNLPNLKGRVPVGLDGGDTDFNEIGKTGGEKTHILTVDEMPKHSHRGTYLKDTNITTAYNVGYRTSPSSETPTEFNDSRGNDQPHNNLQPYEVNNFIIKAFQSAGVVASVVNTQKESDTDVYSCNYINNLNIYSTEETRIGKWIDGKPIYRKVVDLGNLLNANSKLVAHNIANIDFVTSISGLVVSATNHYNIPWTGTPLMLNGAIICIRADRTNIGIANTTNLSSYTAYAFIEYTKTTD